MASLFDTLQANAFRAGIRTRTKESQAWFKRNVTNLQVSPTSILKDKALDKTSQNIRGSMYMYFYDPKHKETLPYYDRFPLTIMVDGAPGGFYGLNLHYLSPAVRARFLDELMKLGPKNMNDTTRLQRMRYKTLKGVTKYKEFKPCFKHYLMNHVESRMVRVPMTEWSIAIFLPTEQFKKKGKSAVWADSNKIIRG